MLKPHDPTASTAADHIWSSNSQPRRTFVFVDKVWGLRHFVLGQRPVEQLRLVRYEVEQLQAFAPVLDAAMGDTSQPDSQQSVIHLKQTERQSPPTGSAKQTAIGNGASALDEQHTSVPRRSVQFSRQSASLSLKSTGYVRPVFRPPRVSSNRQGASCGHSTGHLWRAMFRL